jgi:hypothetical protein
MRLRQEKIMMQRERGLPDSEAADEPTDLLGNEAPERDDTMTR